MSTVMPDTVDLADVRRRCQQLEWMFFDVDGVMTDGGLFYNDQGEAFKRFNVLDGHGLKALKAAGIKIAILSGRSHPATAARGRELGFDLVIQGQSDKGPAFDALLKTHAINPERCGHMGDDTPDLALFARVAFAAAVPNAHPSVLAQAHWVSSRQGGHGAVRECCDFILESRA
jgi:3-deoxy-D-manno-octulosonate 8-phosphate phosphatase (KDO 8-P phosphatase)